MVQDIKNVLTSRSSNKVDYLYFRNNDVLSGLEDLETIYTIKNFPVYMGATDGKKEEDQFADMCFQISKSSGMVQLNPLVDLNVVYQSSHNSGAIGQVWKDHHQALANFIIKFGKNSVLEIGGYSGILANNCLNHNPHLDWTIIDPHVKPFDSKIKVLNSFFDHTFESDQQYDVIVHSHLIEHVIDLNAFMKTCHDHLKDDGLMIFSFPNFYKFINDRHTNCLNFEHTFCLDEISLERLLSVNSFKFVEKQYFYEDHHIFCCVKKSEVELNSFPSRYEENKNIFLEYFDDLNIFIHKANDILENEPVAFMFGGHVTSQFLISMGLNQDLITCLLDNDSKKHNRRLYGTNLMIKSPQILSNFESPILILKNSLFDKEIKEQVLSINPNVRILTL